MRNHATTAVALALSLTVTLLARVAPVLACTGFLATGPDGPLFGNNEDSWNPNTRMWFVPGEDGRHGAVYFGYDDLSPQGGMNEAGLVFDGFATRAKPLRKSSHKPVFGPKVLVELMAECARVDDVLKFLDRHDLRTMERYMLMFADAAGDSVIVEGDDVIRKHGRFQVVTNFYQSEDPTGKNAYGKGKACVRFEIATQMLSRRKQVDVAEARRVLDAVHVEGTSSTVYSNIYDLHARRIYLYDFHDFSNGVTIDLEKELRKGARVVELPSLFPRNFAREQFVAEQKRDLEKRRKARGAVDLPAASLERFVGAYGNDLGMLHIERKGDALVLVPPGKSPIRLTAASKTGFYALGLMMDYDITFRLAGDGNVEGVNVKGSRGGFTLLDTYLRRKG
jgi:hypothetical protein